MRERLGVLHLVGGTNHSGGVMTYVRSLGKLDVGCPASIWKSSAFQPESNASSFVLAGVNCETDRSTFSDVKNSLAEARALKAWLHSQPHPFILHAHSRMGHLAAAWLNATHRYPTVFQPHALARQTHLYRGCWRKSGGTVLFNSQKSIRHYGFADKNPDLIEPIMDWPSQPALPGGRVRLVATGAFVPGKHMDLLISAHAKMRSLDPNLELHLIGASDPPADPAYQNYILHLAQKSSQVHIHSWNPKWTEFIRADDIFVHAGHPESFGIVILEAFALGCRLLLPPDTFVEEFPVPVKSSGIAQATSFDIAGYTEAYTRLRDYHSDAPALWTLRRSVRERFSIETAQATLKRVYASALGSLRNKDPLHKFISLTGEQ